MKVGLLNFQASMNYGGLLQCYALKTAIQSLGHSCNVINYVPAMHDARGNPLAFLTKRKNYLSKAVFVAKHAREFREKQRLVSEFRREYLRPEPETNLTKQDLPCFTSRYDVICCGSDQIWNLNQGDASDRAFMLDFERDNRSIAYAVSFGDGLKKRLKAIDESLPLIRRFDSISVREREGLEYLSSHGIDAELALDPTLIVEKCAWKPFLGNDLIGHPYVLAYGFENARQRFSDLITVARKAGAELRLPVVNPVLSPGMATGCFENRYATGPIEFLRLVQHAKLVCTNSFHGCIFSIALGIPFVAVFGDGALDEPRKETLLDMAGLNTRAVTPSGEWKARSYLEFDNTSALERLEPLRQSSISFLRKAIGGDGN